MKLGSTADLRSAAEMHIARVPPLHVLIVFGRIGWIKGYCNLINSYSTWSKRPAKRSAGNFSKEAIVQFVT